MCGLLNQGLEMKLVKTTSLVIFVILGFCNPAFPCRALGKVEVVQQVVLGREEEEPEDRTASISARPLVVVMDKNQMEG